jgi:hypothetical protein
MQTSKGFEERLLSNLSAWTKEEIIERLANPLENRRAVSKMLQALYLKQTAGEQAQGDTCEHNGEGFNGTDAAFLSSVAVNSRRFAGNLTDGQCKAVAKALKKYAGQLSRISKAVAQERNLVLAA